MLDPRASGLGPYRPLPPEVLNCIVGILSLEVFGRLANVEHSDISIIPFHGFSSALKSLAASPPDVLRPQVFDPISSLPLFEGTTCASAGSDDDGLDSDGSSSSSPKRHNLTISAERRADVISNHRNPIGNQASGPTPGGGGA